MKRSRFTETQIVKIPKEAQAGVAVTELSLEPKHLKEVLEKSPDHR